MKMNFTNNQIAFDYAIYMIVGSYFRKTTCKNDLQEKRMRLHYCEQKVNNQYRMEDICISYVEKKLMKTLPKEIWDEEMAVKFITGKDGFTRVCFVGEKYNLYMCGQYGNNKKRFSCKIKAKFKKLK